MRYMGSKRRLAKDILPIILRDRKPDQWYVEPFVGGGNIIDKVQGLRMGNDSHYYVIELLKAVQDGWVPPTDISPELYSHMREFPHLYPAREVGFVGFACSFGGMWWSSYAKDKEGRNYAGQGSRSLLRQASGLVGVKFTNLNYMDLLIPPESVVYCDPPYAGTATYSGADKFDAELFWAWCRDLSESGHKVFVSEYEAPTGWQCCFEKSQTIKLHKTKSGTRVERLFQIE